MSQSTTTDTTDAETTNTTSADLEAYLDLTGFQRDILHAIHAIDNDSGTPETYGLAIKRRLEDWRAITVNHGRLYPNLDDLKNKGLVEKHSLDKRTNEYTLTRLGERVLAAAHAYLAASGGGV